MAIALSKNNLYLKMLAEKQTHTVGILKALS
jgi:hypothetical protein